jgi:2-keto-myo-inositol isomerase
MNEPTHEISLNRRQLLGGVAVGAAALNVRQTAADEVRVDTSQQPSLQYALNMSTIRGQKLSVPEQVDVAAKAGYDAIEPWLGELHKYVETGGSLQDLKKRIADHGLKVVSAIGFAEWILDDEARRAAGLEVAKKDMGIVAAIGGTHIAAPPAGATRQTDMNLLKVAERYRALLELGEREGVIPELEIWGHSTTLGKLSEALLVAAESKHPQACLLLDVFHLYKGGSDFTGLRLVNGAVLPCLHFNDYPASPPRETIKDADRIFPGDGAAPLTQLLRDLVAAGFQGALSLEIFNATYWKEDPYGVARIGLAKMKEAVAKATA